MRKKSSIQTETIAVRVPSTLKEYLEIIASKEERTLSQQVIYYLKQGIKAYDDAHPPKNPRGL